MSRTIRRQHAHQARHYIDRPQDIDAWDLNRYGTSSVQACIARQRAFFHGDARSGLWGVPSWYSRLENQRQTTDNDRELRRCWNRQCWDDHLSPWWRRCTGYYWW